LDWNLLDAGFRENLDIHHYFSPSGHAKHAAKQVEGADYIAEAKSPPKDPKPEPNIDYTTLELDSDDDSVDETEIPSGSLFDYHIPGILTKEEVEKLELDKWKFNVRNRFVDMEDLNGWEESKITDPQSLKGIVAELAAALGPEVVKGGSAVTLF
jgi:hypothetical protein